MNAEWRARQKLFCSSDWRRLPVMRGFVSLLLSLLGVIHERAGSLTSATVGRRIAGSSMAVRMRVRMAVVAVRRGARFGDLGRLVMLLHVPAVAAPMRMGRDACAFVFVFAIVATMTIVAVRVSLPPVRLGASSAFPLRIRLGRLHSLLVVVARLHQHGRLEVGEGRHGRQGGDSGGGR